MDKLYANLHLNVEGVGKILRQNMNISWKQHFDQISAKSAKNWWYLVTAITVLKRDRVAEQKVYCILLTLLHDINMQCPLEAFS